MMEVGKKQKRNSPLTALAVKGKSTMVFSGEVKIIDEIRSWQCFFMEEQVMYENIIKEVAVNAAKQVGKKTGKDMVGIISLASLPIVGGICYGLGKKSSRKNEEDDSGKAAEREKEKKEQQDHVNYLRNLLEDCKRAEDDLQAMISRLEKEMDADKQAETELHEPTEASLPESSCTEPNLSADPEQKRKLVLEYRIINDSCVHLLENIPGNKKREIPIFLKNGIHAEEFTMLACLNYFVLSTSTIQNSVISVMVVSYQNIVLIINESRL